MRVSLSGVRVMSKTHEEFVKEMTLIGIEVLGTYTKAIKTVKLKCPSCGDDWSPLAYNVRKGKVCRKCGYKKNSKKQIKEHKDFLSEMEGSNFIILGVYKGGKKLIEVQCKKCLNISNVKPNNLLNGSGCAYCSGTKKKTTKEVQELLSRRGISLLGTFKGNKYNYDFSCDDCFTLWNTSAHNVLQGSGCPSCATSGFDKNKPAYVYYLRVGDREAYKIGITNREVEKRTHYETNISIVKTWFFTEGKEALAMETEILKRYKAFQYKGDKLLITGNTELFTADILGLDYDKKK